METFSVILGLLAVLLFVLAIVGLIKPSWVKKSSRAKAFGIFASASFVCLILGAIAAPTKTPPQNQAIQGGDSSTAPEPQAAKELVVEEQTAPPAQEEAPKNKNPRLNFDAVVAALRNDFKVKVEYAFGEDFCPQPNACHAIADGIQVMGIGHIVDAQTSVKASPKTYQTVCAAILAGLSGAHKDTVWSINKEAFDYAAQNGRAVTKLGNVDIKITPNSSSNLLQCSYVRVIR